MRAIYGLVLIVGVGLAGFAVYMAQGYISQTQAELARERAMRKPPEQTVTVYVAKKALAYGETLTKDDVEAINWPAKALPPTAFTQLDGKDVKRALFVKDEDPRQVLRPIGKFEPLLDSNVTKPGQPAGITARLTPGMRAFAISVNVSTGVSGFLRPGDHVDVYWTASSQQGDITRLIEPGVKIIAVDQKAGGEVGPGAIIARTVTVEVTQEQVAVLAQAESSGRLALSLVGARDESAGGKIEVSRNELLGIHAAPAAAPKPEKKVCTITQRNGDKVTQIPVPCTN